MAETTIEGITLSQLPKVTTLAANDLIEIDRNGTGAAVSYANLVEAMADSLGRYVRPCPPHYARKVSMPQRTIRWPCWSAKPRLWTARAA